MPPRPGPAPALVDALRRRLAETAVPGIVSAWLYGSHARGRAHRESDVDVAILLSRQAHPGAGDRFDARARLGTELAAATGGAPVDVIILNDVPPHLARNVLWTGVRLAGTDPEAEHAFTRDVQLRAADLEPFLRRARRRKLEALAR